jgi:hypothetical protein
MDVTVSKFRRFGRYMIGYTLIPHTNNIKLLGLNIAHNLSWKYHTETVRAKSAKLIGFVSRNLRGCSPKVKQQAFITLIRPIMSFGAPAWHPTTHGNIYKLQMLQNRASRFIFGKHSSHELDDHVLSYNTYLLLVDLLYFYKVHYGFIDSHVLNAVREGRPIRGQEGVSRLIPPKARTKMYQQGFVYRCTLAWNELPSDVKTANVSAIKSSLKSYCKSVN